MSRRLAARFVRVATLVAALGAMLGAASGCAPDGPGDGSRMLGYAASSARAQRRVERSFRSRVRADSISALHLPLTTRPHPAGSPGSAQVIAYLQAQLRAFGLEVESHEYSVWLSSPRRVRVTRTSPTVRELSLREPALPDDPTSTHPELGDAYVAYSASGVADGALVYVNYGLPSDYEELAAGGVQVQGRIAIARYGRSHRAVKVFAAQQAGARALILYSDPADDGFAKGRAWPAGYWRGEQMPQRGNAKMSWYWHGDALTPGHAGTSRQAALAPRDAPTLPSIPVVALAWGEALHLLSTLGGPVAPEAWRGALPITYRVGPGGGARVEVAMDDGFRPITNVVARVAGAVAPERVVMLGTHHDAWTFGGVDPGTGAAALLEVARVLGTMRRDGWRPARTIALAFWDAEEFGLVGSTEFAEALRAQLREQLVLYVNTDMYMRGRFDAGGVPSLRDFVLNVVRDVPASDSARTTPGPTGGTGSVLDGWRASDWARAPIDRRPPSAATYRPDLKPLGSGADFVAFQDHLAIPTLSIEFIGSNGYGFGTYHTNYDSRAYVERVADPGFRQGVILSRVLGTLALRMSGADVLPFRFSHYAARLEEALGSVSGWQPARDRPAVAVDVAPLLAAARRVGGTAQRLEQRTDALLARWTPSAATLAPLNDRLARLEQSLADDDAHPERAWYRHVLYGWNIYSLYDGQPFPGLADAIREGDAQRVAHERDRIARALARMHQELEAALDLLPH